MISVDASNLSKRGSKRLVTLVSDLKRLFDSRVWVCIFDGLTIAGELKEIIDYRIGSDISMSQAPVKQVQNIVSSPCALSNKQNSVEGFLPSTFYGGKPSVDTESPNIKDHQLFNSSELDDGLKTKVSDLESSVNKWKADYRILSDLFSDVNKEYEKVLEKNEQMRSEFKSKEQEWEVRHSKNLKEIAEFKKNVGELETELRMERNRSKELENKFNITEDKAKQTSAAQFQSKEPQQTTTTVRDVSPISLRGKIEKSQLQYSKASPAEILQKCLGYLRYDADFQDEGAGVADRFICKLRVRNVDLNNFGGKIWEGRGKSKYLAKQNAFEELIKAIKCD